MENPNHDADLQRFFSKVRKMVHLKENSKFKYIIENEEFRLVNKNNNNDQSEVSVKRLPKLYIEDEIKKKNIDIQEIGTKLLSSKYEFLFGFKNMGEYEKELHSVIEPNEVKYETLRKEVEELRDLKYKPKVLMKRQMEELKLQQNVSIETLKELEQEDLESTKKAAMIDYIYKQKDMLDLLMNSPKENREINPV
tara:strand:- start:6201 stop:6785 length:585 start_codon:yes stop_codon:yes gene_type:complete